jgi:two-component system, NtrC family, response regulator AtoC
MSNSSPTTFDLRIPSEEAPSRNATYYLAALTDEQILVLPLPPNGSLLIGRDASADIRLDGGAVSREHARVHSPAEGGSASAEDLGSRNGTFIQGKRLPPRERVPLAVGSTLWIGGAALTLRRGEPPRLRGPKPGLNNRVIVAPEMVTLYQHLSKIAPSRLSVLVLGETGVGKEVVAESLHEMAGPPGRPYVRLNCAALPPDLLESELFGVEKGAFTGATVARAGLLEVADGGTLYLDEVGELPLALQSKMLRMLESGEFFRLGAAKGRRANVRFVAATNRDLKTAVARAEFRADLYYRLNGLSVVVPPLRSRTEEILPLALLFADRIDCGPGSPPVTFTESAAARLLAYPWPGNIRELKSVVERSVLLSDGGRIDSCDLIFDAIGGMPAAAASAPMSASAAGDGGTVPPRGENAESTERDRILAALESCAFNQTRAAEMLGMPRRTLVYKVRQYALPRPRD